MARTGSALLRTMVLLVLLAPRLSAGQVDCGNPDNLCTGDPCVIGSVTVAPSCVVSFAPRSVVIEGSLLIPGGGTLSLSGGTITVGGRIVTSQVVGKPRDGASVTLAASDDVLVGGTIRTTGSDSTGDIRITAGRNVELAGRLWAATGVGGSPGGVVVRAGGTVRVASPIVTKGDYAAAGTITLAGDDGVIVERPLDTTAGRGRVAADYGGAVHISSATGPVTVASKIDTRGIRAGDVTITAASNLSTSGKINVDATCFEYCVVNRTATSGGVILRSTGGDVDVAGNISARGRLHGPIAIDAAGQARVRASIGGRSRANDGRTIAVAADRVSVEAPARLEASGIERGGAVRVTGGTVWVGPGTLIRAQGQEDGKGEVYIHATAGAATVSGLVVADGAPNEFSRFYRPGVIEVDAIGDLTADGTFQCKPAGCIAASAGGALDVSTGSFDRPVLTDCPGDATFCGDGVATGAEVCDGSDECAPGLGIYCNNSCTACDRPSCGDSIVAGSEVCDGSVGCPPGTYCNFCFECVPYCGDGIVAGSEICEQTSGCTAPEACDATCSACGLCGNGSIDGSETCDGFAGCAAGSSCDATCSSCAACPVAKLVPAAGGTFPGKSEGYFSPLYFEWTPAVSGVATLDLCESSYDTKLTILKGGCGGPFLQSDFNASCRQSGGSRLAQAVVAGETYTIIVAEANSFGGGHVLKVIPPE